ncbi:MAG: acyltransferase [Spirochaetaceae bacterium]|jgi:acetyltransferase-like isoleucine patch superfamily enzyme|nr:acyltransferase [Spirochaetaceae bacterium]
MPLKQPHSSLNLRDIFFNRFCPNIRKHQGKIRFNGRAICTLDAGAGIYLCADLSLGHNLVNHCHAETYLKMHKDSQLYVNGYFKVFYGSSIEIFPGGVLSVGKGYINSGCVISCAKSITIEDGAAIARGVKIYDSDHHKIVDEHNGAVNCPKPIVIKRNVLVGVNAVILKGVTIGEGAVIAAGAVVTHNVAANCIAAGVPAVIIRQNINWS